MRVNKNIKRISKICLNNNSETYVDTFAAPLEVDLQMSKQVTQVSIHDTSRKRAS